MSNWGRNVVIGVPGELERSASLRETETSTEMDNLISLSEFATAETEDTIIEARRTNTDDRSAIADID
ncbi:hypothetical protein Moror_8658 [Moniliophthora roreri MCA 2997]|uniref:Uncharacterized protein n=1 Tax=Moniliophthora roreri (strain MCA 2997) TaxID=1381753 RepID=V2X747_MONRO|nr:hypothetical protein Moror_8658 [Moniliophthora roreri MCA 2997]KAI3611337.1 hypothetical protein WG66_002228 [Moniliophthora roreri]